MLYLVLAGLVGGLIWLVYEQVKEKFRKCIGGEAASKEFFVLAKDNVVTVLFTYQIIAQTSALCELRGGSHLPPPFGSILRWVEEVASLDLFTAFRISCGMTHGTLARG